MFNPAMVAIKLKNLKKQKRFIRFAVSLTWQSLSPGKHGHA
jgi:hypothetical protein